MDPISTTQSTQEYPTQVYVHPYANIVPTPPNQL